MPLNILVQGAGVAGPALALFLQRSHLEHHITIVERASSLRAAGQQIDIRAQGIPLMRKLELLDTIKSLGVAESGIEIVNSKGQREAFFGANTSGKGQQALTSEYEIMRGDLVQLLYRTSLERNTGKEEHRSLKYEFGKFATEITQDSDGVDVTFSDGTTGRYDLVVAADGQGSRIRRMVFGQEASDEAFKSLELWVALYSIPRAIDESETGKAYNAPGARVISTRTGDRPVTQVYLGIMNEAEKLRDSLRQPVEQQKEVWRELFKDAGWQTERLMEGLQTCDDFYAVEIGQVKMNQLHKGRVVLLGDAGYTPSPITGMGTTASFVGAYVLAGELSRKTATLEDALKKYEEVIRPFVHEAQKLPPGAPGLLYPSSQWGITFLHKAVGIFTSLKLDKLINRLSPENKGSWDLPSYPDLNLDS
jgi:2-polyprenyl-6-methoxyphenol hydroxylase-like FAD-dependent oxidoreductase